jgi:hypothetical protein
MGFQTEREQAMADRIQLKEPGSELVMKVSRRLTAWYRSSAGLSPADSLQDN